jgi:recombinational DNA repair ATPase RecF
MRLAEWERLQAASHENPLMLVDDLGMSLDGARRSHLLEYFKGAGQVFVTTTEEQPLVAGEHAIAM